MAQEKSGTKSTLQSAGEKIGDVLSKAKDSIVALGGTVAARSKEMMDVAKLNAQKVKLTDEINESYRAIGKATYDTGRLKKDLAEHGDRIKNNEAELKKIEAEIDRVKSEADGEAAGKMDQAKEKASETGTAAKKAGGSAKTAAKKTASSAKTAAKKTGLAAKTAAKKTGEATKTAAKKTASATRTAAKKSTASVKKAANS